MTRAYVLINAEPGSVAGLLEKLRSLPGVVSADAVTGHYDIVAVLEQPDVNSIGKLVLERVHGMPGLKATMTLIAVA